VRLALVDPLLAVIALAPRHENDYAP
jgi:hypothetical protein